MPYKSLNLNDFLYKFEVFFYCRGLNSPALYRLSYRGMYSVVASNFVLIKRCLQSQSTTFFARYAL